jgi:hypothetical protein
MEDAHLAVADLGAAVADALAAGAPAACAAAMTTLQSLRTADVDGIRRAPRTAI